MLARSSKSGRTGSNSGGTRLRRHGRNERYKTARSRSSSRGRSSRKARPSKPRPSWDDSTSDLSAYRLSESELLRKKISLRSKHNVVYVPEKALREAKRKNDKYWERQQGKKGSASNSTSPGSTPSKGGLPTKAAQQTISHSPNSPGPTELSFEEQSLNEGAEQFNKVFAKHGVLPPPPGATNSASLGVANLDDEIIEFEQRKLVEMRQQEKRRQELQKRHRHARANKAIAERIAGTATSKIPNTGTRIAPWASSQPGFAGGSADEGVDEGVHADAADGNEHTVSESNSLDLILQEQEDSELDVVESVLEQTGSNAGTEATLQTAHSVKMAGGAVDPSLVLMELEGAAAAASGTPGSHSFRQTVSLCKFLVGRLQEQQAEINQCRTQNAELRSTVGELQFAAQDLRRTVERLQLEKKLAPQSSAVPTQPSDDVHGTTRRAMKDGDVEEEVASFEHETTSNTLEHNDTADAVNPDATAFEAKPMTHPVTSLPTTQTNHDELTPNDESIDDDAELEFNITKTVDDFGPNDSMLSVNATGSNNVSTLSYTDSEDEVDLTNEDDVVREDKPVSQAEETASITPLTQTTNTNTPTQQDDSITPQNTRAVAKLSSDASSMLPLAWNRTGTTPSPEQDAQHGISGSKIKVSFSIERSSDSRSPELPVPNKMCPEPSPRPVKVLPRSGAGQSSPATTRHLNETSKSLSAALAFSPKAGRAHDSLDMDLSTDSDISGFVIPSENRFTDSDLDKSIAEDLDFLGSIVAKKNHTAPSDDFSATFRPMVFGNLH